MARIKHYNHDTQQWEYSDVSYSIQQGSNIDYEEVNNLINDAIKDKANRSEVEAHVADKNNPHSVTVSQIGAAPATHNHTKSQITDFPTSMPASDVYAWAKAATKPTYTANEVGAITQDELNTHTTNKSNPHGVTLAQLGLTATAAELNTLDGITATTAELNYVDGVTSNIQTQLNAKANDFSIELYNGNSGNPQPVKFMTVNYSTCGSENGVAIKVSMVSGHGNGSSYAFLQDAIIKVTHTGSVEVDNFKYYGAETALDGTRQFGDIFWVIDTTNKIVDFYCLMGQYARLQMTPYKRVTYSTGGTITQYTSCAVYSSGEKVWANNSEIATKNSINEAISALNIFSAGTSAPTNTKLLWIDTTATTGGLKYYNGSSWVHVPVAYT